ncbi:MAG: transglycosylase SLT domain-containing protein [bacterium]
MIKKFNQFLAWRGWGFAVISLLLLWIFFPHRIGAKVYKYTDSNGVTHYTDRPVYHDFHIYSEDYDDYDEIDSVNEIFLDRIINRVSRVFNIDSNLIRAIIKVESNFNTRAVSRAGAKGLMQLMPKTAYKMDVSDPFNPEENIFGGVKYFKYLLDRFDNNLEISLAAYNAGETAVLKYGGIPKYRETRQYVKKVLKQYSYYKSKRRPDDRVYLFVDDDNILHITNTSGPFLEGISN